LGHLIATVVRLAGRDLGHEEGVLVGDAQDPVRRALVCWMPTRSALPAAEGSAAESGVPVIETSHEASEVPGVRRFAEILRCEHPDVAFGFHDDGAAWEWA